MTAPFRRLGPYEILEELKSGGMGDVLLARRRGPGAFEQLVAIKTIRPEHASTAAVRAMFLDEAAILARLNHPGVATVHDFGDEGGTLYMVMEYVAGIPFREVAALRPPPLVIARALAEAARGLHAAHELRDHGGGLLGVVHRDISPDNLMLGFDGHVKVIDFGIALVKNRAAPVTEIGTLKGKPPYMSPEQVRNQPLDRRSDVFSLGVVGWEMLTDQLLFDGDSLYAIAIAVGEQVIAPPSQVVGPLPIGLDASILGALDRDVAHRTASAADFATQLEQVTGAAGGETLAGWAERELRPQREAHRAWLSEVVVGTKAEALPKGRPTGLVTAVPSDAKASASVAAMAAVQPLGKTELAMTAPVGRELGTHVGAGDGDAADDANDDQPALATRRTRAPIAIAALVLVVGVAVVAVTQWPHAATRGERARDAAVAHDAASPMNVDASTVPIDVRDAPPIAPVTIPADAALDIDAGHRTIAIRDASVPATPRPHPDAAAPTPAIVIDAPAPPALTGTGTLKLTCNPYCNVSIDGAPVGVTPQLHRTIAAGRHTVEFTDPASGSALATKTVTIHDGEKLELRP